MRKKDVVFTKEQEKCLHYPVNKDLLIRGIAGSGKSLIIFRRAIEIAKKIKEENSDKKIAIFTYANSLVDYTKELLEHFAQYSDIIKVSTLDKELWSIYSKLIGRRVGAVEYNISFYSIKNIIKRKSGTMSSRFLDEQWISFLQDELAWMKQRMIRTQSDYLKSVRVGRGSVRPSAEDRKVIYSIYEEYYDNLKRYNKLSVDGMYQYVYDHRSEISDSLKYNYVFVDECQDLALNKLLLARELVLESITLAADNAQKIYKTGFTWKELNIDIRGNASKKLHGTYRNTKQIVELANCLVKKNAMISNPEDGYTEPELPTKEGAKPVLYYAHSKFEEKEFLIKYVKDVMERRPNDTIAIIIYEKKAIDNLATELREEGIDYQKIQKGEDYKVLLPGVKLVTFHSSKGLEFDNVIIPFLDKDNFPHLNALDKKAVDENEDQLADELFTARNLLYVAMTRARYDLCLIADNGTIGPSEVLEDLDKELYEIKNL